MIQHGSLLRTYQYQRGSRRSEKHKKRIKKRKVDIILTWKLYAGKKRYVTREYFKSLLMPKRKRTERKAKATLKKKKKKRKRNSTALHPWKHWVRSEKYGMRETFNSSPIPRRKKTKSSVERQLKASPNASCYSSLQKALSQKKNPRESESFFSVF